MIGSVSVLMALLHLVTVPIANAGPAEDEVFASFETYCIAHLNQSEKIPELLKQDEESQQLIELLLSFESWERLRELQGMSKKNAIEVIRFQVKKLLDLEGLNGTV